MADLIQAFFQRDLDDAEQEALGKLLEGSSDEVLRYEGLLEKNYSATGLPLPSLPKGLQDLPPAGEGGWAGGSGLGKVLLGALAAAGILAWTYWPRSQAPAGTAPKVRPGTGLKVPQGEAPRGAAPTRPAPAQPPAEGEELSVVVDSPGTSLVTVRILDPSGREVRSLYTGFVQPGRRTFTWDGLLADGQPAPAGDYRIDVVSGPSHQSKAIKIRLK